MAHREIFDLTIRLRVVRESDDDGFDADETPSLPGMSVYDTTGEEVTQTRRPLAKCGPVTGAERRRKAAK